MDMDQNIFQISLLAADSVNPHATHGVAHQSQPRSRFHWLLLLCVAREDGFSLHGVLRVGECDAPGGSDSIPASSTMMVVSPSISIPPRAARRSSLSTQNGPRIDIVAQRHSCPPGHGGGDDALPVFTVEIGNGPQRRGLA